MKGYDWSNLKNYKLWVTVSSLILLILKQCHANIDAATYSQIVFYFLNALVLAHVILPAPKQTPAQSIPQLGQLIETLQTVVSELPSQATGEHVLQKSTKEPPTE